MAQNPSDTGSVSEALDGMVCNLLGAYLDSLAEGGDPGVVLAIEDAQSNCFQAAFTDDGEEQCLDAAEAFVQGHAQGYSEEGVGPIERYAIAYTGAVDIDGCYEDAIMVSFFECGMDVAYSAYVLFSHAGEGENFMWSDPEPAGEEPPLL